MSNTLDEILNGIEDYCVQSALGGTPFKSEEENIADNKKAYDDGRKSAKQQIQALITEAKNRGYNSGWVAASRVKPEKFAYFAKQLEDAATKLRNMESQLKEDKK